MEEIFFSQTVYMIRDLHLEYVKNLYNSIKNFKMDGQRI